MENQIVKINQNNAVKYNPYTSEEVNKVIESIRQKCVVKSPDISTEKGRKEITDAASRCSSMRVAFVKEIEEAIAPQKEFVKIADAERIRAEKELKQMRLDILAPVTEWKEKEEARKRLHEDRIKAMESLKDVLGCNSRSISDSIYRLDELFDCDWQEFATRAGRIKDDVHHFLVTSLDIQVTREKEQEELERLRLEAEERAKKEREEEIRKEAAEQARLQAQREAERKAEAARIEEQERINREKLEREREREELERAKQHAEREKQEALEREKAAIAAKERAIEQERQRVEQERIRLEEEDKKRAADKKHKSEINNAALNALVDGGLSKEDAKKAVTLIASGKIPNVFLKY